MGRGESGSAGHPRMRGEHRVFLEVLDTVYGPSPHARGTPHLHHAARRRVRAIPACAGNTAAVYIGLYDASGHPRMRGEHYQARCQCSIQCGPSPHARGTLTPILARNLERRAIPACAGNTPFNGASAMPNSGHPRMRGEHSSAISRSTSSSGPSPHARGTRLLCY